jgi:hypothetical protein
MRDVPDPIVVVHTRPWSVAWDIPWRNGLEMKEYVCQENNQYLINVKDDFGRPFFEAK